MRFHQGTWAAQLRSAQPFSAVFTKQVKSKCGSGPLDALELEVLSSFYLSKALMALSAGECCNQWFWAYFSYQDRNFIEVPHVRDTHLNMKREKSWHALFKENPFRAPGCLAILQYAKSVLTQRSSTAIWRAQSSKVKTNVTFLPSDLWAEHMHFSQKIALTSGYIAICGCMCACREYLVCLSLFLIAKSKQLPLVLEQAPAAVSGPNPQQFRHETSDLWVDWSSLSAWYLRKLPEHFECEITNSVNAKARNQGVMNVSSELAGLNAKDTKIGYQFSDQM